MKSQMSFYQLFKAAMAFLAVPICCSLVAHSQDPQSNSQTDKPVGEQPQQQDSVQDDEQPPKPEPFLVKVADQSILFTVDGSWKKVDPKSNMIEAEIKIPKLDADAQDGRLTIMGAGGTIEANITRWEQQFSVHAQPIKKEVKTIAGQKVHLVDISGTYIDTPGGPFSGGAQIERENYRMLAAIIQTDRKGNYFVKLYGPKHTIDKNEKVFKSMIESLEVKD